jgi:hypothetical protein
MVWLLNGLLNLDSSSEVLHIMRKFGNRTLSLNQAVQQFMIISRTSTEIICAHTISVKINGLFYKPVKLSTYEELEVV